jgi:hypothetical protein
MSPDSQDTAEALDDSVVDDPAPDKPLAVEDHGTTAEEQRRPETPADRARREQPDRPPADRNERTLDLVDPDPLDRPGDDGELTGEGVHLGNDPTTADYPTEREAPLPAEVAALHIEGERGA